MMRQSLARFGAVASLYLALIGCSDTKSECWREVEAAYRKPELSGLLYRVETISVVNGQTATSTLEFVPPDRRRIVTIDSEGGPWLEAIQVGRRVWTHLGDLVDVHLLAGALGATQLRARSPRPCRPSHPLVPQHLECGLLTGT